MSEPDLLDHWRTQSRRRNTAARFVVFFSSLLGVTLLICLIWPDEVISRVDGERDLTGDYLYQPAHPSALTEIDLDHVHRFLLPAWAIALVHRDTRGPKAEDARWKELVAALKADENLVSLVRQIRKVALNELVFEQAERLQYLTWAWSQYLQQEGADYSLHANVMRTAGGDYFYLKSYRITKKLSVESAGQSYPVHVVRRLDRTNIKELYLGAASGDDSEAIVVLDRIDEYAEAHIWSLMSEPPIDDGNARLRAYLQSKLGNHIEVLNRTGAAQNRIQKVLAELEIREDCLTIQVPASGRRGLSVASLDFLKSVEPSDNADPDCLDFTHEEYLILNEASEVIRAEQGLDAALRALTQALIVPVAVHEAQHLADQHQDTRMECEECLPAHVLAEASAYLASFAHESGPLAFYQACGAMERGGGPHVQAIQAILDAMDIDCDGIPVDLAKRARAAEVKMFGRSSNSQFFSEQPLKHARDLALNR